MSRLIGIAAVLLVVVMDFMMDVLLARRDPKNRRKLGKKLDVSYVLPLFLLFSGFRGFPIL